MWSREENLAWVTLSKSAPGEQQAHSPYRRDAVAAGRRRGIPTAVKVAAILALVLLIVLAGLIWVAPMLLGPDFSLSHIVGSLLGEASAGAAAPPGLLA